VIHEYRFQLDVGADAIGSIEIYWKGFAENADEISLYYYTYNFEYRVIPQWKKLNSSDYNGVREFNETLDQENASLAVMDDNYFYFCVVARRQLTSPCSLSADYVRINSLAENAWDKGPGEITTKTSIAPDIDDFYWEMFTWKDYNPSQTSARYQILYDSNDDGNFTPIPDDLEYFDGSNEQGFTNSPIYLNKIPTRGENAITKLRIRANLSSETAAKTPKIYNWGITWQKDHDHWQDSFNSTYRISSKSKVNIKNGNVNISSLQGEWPMFGYNPQNTRSTDGRGPQGSSAQLKWWSDSRWIVGGGFKNPVIGDDYIYVFNSTDDEIIRFNLIGDKSHMPEDSSGDLAGVTYNNTPLITEDYIIIASGNTGDNGVQNYIIGLAKDDLTNEVWKFKHDDKLCYYASPVVSDNVLYITTWNSDTKLFSDLETNKVIALDLEAIGEGGDFTNDNDILLWEYELPAGSYSTPAVYDDKVFVGCTASSGESLFVLDAQGNGDKTTNLIWSSSVGSIGRAAPVIYDDTVFVTSKTGRKMKITALDISANSSERILWENEIATLVVLASADSTPAVFDGVLYTVSPRGNVYALNTTNGAELWSTNVYTVLNPLKGFLTSSPVYADGFLYIGTPDGKIFALDTNDNGSEQWKQDTFESETFAHAPIYTSPIVSNEMLFISDEFGTLYAFGDYAELNKEMQGSLTSIPINLPTGDWWGTFSANFSSDPGSTVQFSILDDEKQHIRNISSGDHINLGNRPTVRTIYLHADLTADNITVNPVIRFWKVTFETDTEPPDFVRESFIPHQEGWINEPTPLCMIEVWDNQTGLRLNESTFTIVYDADNYTDIEETYPCEYLGETGENYSLLTADISMLDIADNITILSSIEFSVKDFKLIESITFFCIKFPFEWLRGKFSIAGPGIIKVAIF